MTSTLPPGIPNTFESAINLGQLGLLNPTTHRYNSIFLTQQMLVDGVLDEVYFKFLSALPNGFVTIQTHEYPEYSSWIDGYDSNRGPQYTTNGQANSFNSYQIDSALNYLVSVRDPGDSFPKYDLGVYVTPVSVSDYEDRDGSGTHWLGILQNGTMTREKDTLFTFYDRELPRTTSPTGGQMKILGTKAVADDVDRYTFTLSEAGKLSITPGGTFGTMVLRGPAQGNLSAPLLTQFKSGKTFDLVAGEYRLEVFDQGWTVSTGANLVAIRGRDWELFNEYSLSLTFNAKPDFSVSELSIGSTRVQAGSSTALSFKITNDGGARATTYGIYLSTDSVITTADRLVGFGTLLESVPANGSKTISSTLLLPANLKGGTYFVGVIADHKNTTPEKNESNNASAGTVVTVTTRPTAGNDILTGWSAPETLDGLAGRDSIEGWGGNDSLIGGLGNDTLNGGAGLDTLNGGVGHDTYVLADLDDVIVDAGGIDTVRASFEVSLTTLETTHGIAFENLVLVGGATKGTGNALANKITGGEGNDDLKGLHGNDTLEGNGGNDTLDGGAHTDSLVGGAGDDVYYVDSTSDRVREGLRAGIDTVNSTATFTLGLNVDHLILTGNLNLKGTGNAIANEITGGNGNDTLAGLGGSDRLVGGIGNDSLDGGVANDTLVGGAGDDIYFGSIGADTFVFDQKSGIDAVRDFARIQGDKVEFSAAVFGRLGVDYAFTAGTAASGDGAQVIYNQPTGQLWWDEDGAGGAEQILLATFRAKTALGASDFVVVA